jgi:hypothetical protein
MPATGSSRLLLFPAALLLATALPAPAAAARPLDPGSTFTSGLDLERLPEDGFLAVWQRDATEHLPFGPDTCVHREAVGAQFDHAGILVEGPQPLTFEGETENPSALRVAAAPLRSAWFPVVAYTTAAGLKVADLSGFEVRSPTLVSSCTVHHFDLVTRGLSFWLVWSETCDSHRIRARPIDLDGSPSGPAVTLVEERLAGPAHGFAATLSPAGGLFVAWVERESEGFGDGRRVVAARFRADGSRETPVRAVSGLLLSSSSPGDSIAVARVVASATPVFDHRMVVSWRDEEGAIRLRSFSTDLEPLVEIPVAAGAGARGTGQILDASSFGPLVVAWEPSGDGTGVPACPLRAFDEDLRPLGAPVGLGTDCDAPADLAFADLTTMPLAAWQVSDLPVSVCARTEIAVVHPPGLEPAPQGPPIESPAFPGFVFHARIGGDEPNPRFGAEEPDCLPETVCVSGALPGRTEVLLRIVGPKPNGFLWPTIVRFTTSQVEVWIEQLATGEVRYYRLDGSTPGSEDLDGLFDRDGFQP